MKSSEKAEIGARITSFAENKGWSKSFLASKVGVHQQNINRYLNGKSDPSKIIINLIGSGLNPEWAKTGEGDMYTKKEGNYEEESEKEQTSTLATIYPALNAPLTPAQQAINANAKTATPTTNANSPAHTPASSTTNANSPAHTPASSTTNANTPANTPAPAHKTTTPPPAHHNKQQNNILTPIQQAINANAETIAIKNSPYFYEAIGKNLALHEEDIHEGDILIIDPTITPLQGELTLQGTPDGPKFTRYHPSHTNTKGVVVSLTRQYPAINRQPT